MSDRIAVFRLGQIEQIGTPTELYEHPATSFVATFVGTSNLFDAEIARTVTGSDQPFSIRPEKIHLVEPDAVAPDGMWAFDGQIEDTVYLGMNTRYRVKLTSGPEIVVVDQNRDSEAPQRFSVRGRRVRVMWSKTAINPLTIDT